MVKKPMLPEPSGTDIRDAKLRKKNIMTGGRMATGGSAQLERDLKTNKPINKGKGPMYEAGNKSELARQARKIALKRFGEKSKQYKRTLPAVPDSIIKRKEK